MVNPVTYVPNPKAVRREMEHIEDVLANVVTYDDIRKDALWLCDMLRKALNEVDDRRAGFPT